MYVAGAAHKKKMIKERRFFVCIFRRVKENLALEYIKTLFPQMGEKRYVVFVVTQRLRSNRGGV